MAIAKNHAKAPELLKLSNTKSALLRTYALEVTQMPTNGVSIVTKNLEQTRKHQTTPKKETANKRDKFMIHSWKEEPANRGKIKANLRKSQAFNQFS